MALSWEGFKGALSLKSNPSFLRVVADATESILAGMETVTAKHAALDR